MKRPSIRKGDLVKLHKRYAEMLKFNKDHSSVLNMDIDGSTVFMVWCIRSPDRIERKKLRCSRNSLAPLSGRSFVPDGSDGAAIVIIVDCRTKKEYCVRRRLLWRLPNQMRGKKKGAPQQRWAVEGSMYDGIGG